MKKNLLFIFLLLVAMPVFATENACGIVGEYTKKAAQLIMIAAPILLILLSSVDILGAVTASDEKAMSKCFNTIIKRFIICVVILLLPILVNFIMGWTTFNNLVACWS